MKRILSFFLIITMIMSVAVFVTAAATNGFYISDKPYENVKPMNGHVIGYMGDVDDDDTVSVMDATAIQMHNAQLFTFVGDVLKLSDVDSDSSVSVMDATEIQMWIAELMESSVIAHTLYVEKSSDSHNVNFDYDKTVAYVIEEGEYDEEFDEYYLSYYFNDEQWLDSFYLAYAPSEGLLYMGVSLHNNEDLSLIDTNLAFEEGSSEFWFVSNKSIFLEDYDRSYVYGASGFADIVNGSSFGFVINDEYVYPFNDTQLSYMEAKDEFISNIFDVIAMVDVYVNG